jgi:hypothetical protein
MLVIQMEYHLFYYPVKWHIGLQQPARAAGRHRMCPIEREEVTDGFVVADHRRSVDVAAPHIRVPDEDGFPAIDGPVPEHGINECGVYIPGVAHPRGIRSIAFR